MPQMGRGRPRKAGARNAKGRLIAVADMGNMRVVERANAFAAFRRTQTNQQVGDQIGRVWAAGLLDGNLQDAAILRDIGRRYASLYWRQFADMAPKTRQMEKQDRSVANDTYPDDKAGHYFAALERAAQSAGREAMTAMHALCVDGWWFPDTDIPWIARLITSALRDVGSHASGQPATPSDRARLNAAIDALLAMTEGSGKSS